PGPRCLCASFFFSSRRRHTRSKRDWSSDVCSSDLTYERADLQMPTVVKRNGTRIAFDATKLRASMDLALRKRPVSTDAVDNAVARIQNELLRSGKREVDSLSIGELVMNELLKLDQVAYVRFASVYKSFEDIGEFIHAINEMQDGSEPPDHK